jgi:Protein of unknown function (DUF3995)
MPHARVPRRGALSRPAYATIAWCLAFAALHVYWAVGGRLGLASSAGPDLAATRPEWFVVVGLWGTAGLLILGAGLAVLLSGDHTGRRRVRRAVIVSGWLIGVLLSARALILETLLATDAGGIRSSVGPLETRWSLVLWNPWFLIGGCAFALTARSAMNRRRWGQQRGAPTTSARDRLPRRRG